MIDTTKLKRDYTINPLKRNEKPFREDIEYLYLDLNIGKKELCNYLGLSSSRFQRIIQSFGIKKSLEQLEELAKKGIGASSPFCNKQTHIKARKTKLERYGSETYNNSSKNITTSLERYGVSNPSKKHLSKEVLDIIDNKENLVKYITNNNIQNIVELQSKLGIGYKTLQTRIIEWDLSYLFNYNGSTMERDIREYVNKFYQTEDNTKKYLDGKEIDIYIPTLNLGIEFNGNFWHNEYGKSKNYHQDKSLLAESKEIFIYHIFEYEWVNNKEKILNQLNNLLGINQAKIYARKCVIKEVDNSIKSKFLELNHVQGDDSSSIKIGLYYDDELVSLMTFTKPRFNKNYQYELSRFCSKAGCNVVGGASRLFKHFINEYKPDNVISYSNIAHTKGKIYSTLGFTLKDISEPNYVWLNHLDVLSRYQCQKHKLLEQGFMGDSEVEIMHNRKYFRIYDCGNKVWVWNR